MADTWARQLVVPDFVAPLTGWRAWHVSGDRLFGYFGEAWPLDGPLEARHVVLRDRREPACSTSPSPPDPHKMLLLRSHTGQGCGIYAFDSALALDRAPCYTSPPLVLGTVVGWGRVYVHETGWRAQYARPTALVLPPTPHRSLADARSVARTARAYGVELTATPPELAGFARGRRNARRRAAARFDKANEA